MLILFSLLAPSAFSQMNVDLNIPDNTGTTDDLWRVSVSAFSSQTQLLDIQMTVYDEDEKALYKAILPEVVIIGGQTLNISESQLSKLIVEVQLESYDDEKARKKENNKIPVGDYVVCVSVFTNDPFIEINRSCEYFSVKNTLLDSLLQIEKPSPKLQYHGNAEAFSYFDIYTNSSSVQHRNTGLFFNPEIQLFSYPLSVSLYYDTDSDFYYENIPTFQFNLDTKKYQTILEDRLKQKLSEKSGILPEQYSNAVGMIEEFDGLESLTENPYFQEELNYLDSLKVYQNYLSDSAAIALLNEKIDSYQAIDYEQLLADSLQADSSDMYLQMQAQRDSLLQVRDSVTQKIEQGKALIEKAKSYQNILARKDDLQTLILQDTTVSKVKAHYDEFKNFNADEFTDPEAVKDRLKNIEQLKKLESFISGFNALQFGATAPAYSEFSISGVLLNGLNVNYQLGDFRVVGIAGRINDNSSFFRIDREQHTYSELYVGGFEQQVSDKLSYGVYVLNSDFTDEDSLSFYNFLESNHAVAGKFSSALLKNKLKVEGELAISYAKNKDAELFEEESGGAETSPFWIVQAFAQKDNLDKGSFTDKAGKLTLSTTAFRNNTTLSATTRYTGTGFYTPGNPFLLNDLLNIELGADQYLWKKKITVSAYIIKNQDNLDGLKETTTSYYNMRAGLRLNFPKLPLLSLDYLPNVIINVYDQVEVNTFSATTAYSYRIGKLPCIISGSFIDLHTLSALNDSTNFSSRFYQVINNFSFTKFSIQTGWNLNEATSTLETIYFQTFNAGTRFTATQWLDVFANLQFTAGESGAFDPGGQCELNIHALKTLQFKAGFYAYPEQTADYITNIQNISNTSAYISATYNF